MEKAKYLFKRILNMNYKNFFSVINRIHKKTKKSRIFIFFDVIYCGIKYQAGYFDYELFEMYDLNKEQRKTVLTRGINNHYVKKYNDPKYTPIFLNKDKFNEKFSKFIKRDWMLLNGNNEEEFNKFIDGKDEIIAKPTNGTHGSGILKLKPNKNTYKKLMSTNSILVEEVIKQEKHMNKLNPSSVNTIRVITLNDGGKSNIVVAYLRIGNNKIVDNFNGGGMVAPIDIEQRKILYPAVDKKGNVYYEHPTTKTSIVGFEIPYFDEIEKMVIEASKVIPEVKYIGWDVALSEKGPCLVEGNDFPGHDIYQLPPHRTNGIGVLPKFEDKLKR